MPSSGCGGGWGVEVLTGQESAKRVFVHSLCIPKTQVRGVDGAQVVRRPQGLSTPARTPCGASSTTPPHTVHILSTGTFGGSRARSYGDLMTGGRGRVSVGGDGLLARSEKELEGVCR
ncbi:hypothetical protein GCM10009584_31430 [Ornithinimicrobium humiphilum]